jgi:putative oxidoreductase
MRYTVPLGRILFATIFVYSSRGLFAHQAVVHAGEHGVPMASVLVPVSGVLALLGGLSIALGYRARWGAWLLVLFLVPVTLMMHNFWAVKDPNVARLQQSAFLKNVSMLGGALLLTHFGAGPVSLDARRHHRARAREKVAA